MIPLPHPDFFINKFVDVKVPTKRQIFLRVGANAPGALYSGDTAVKPGMKPTEQADAFINAAESYEPPKQEFEQKDDLPE